MLTNPPINAGLQISQAILHYMEPSKFEMAVTSLDLGGMMSRHAGGGVWALQQKSVRAYSGLHVALSKSKLKVAPS